jgi:hypothetical protein
MGEKWVLRLKRYTVENLMAVTINIEFAKLAVMAALKGLLACLLGSAGCNFKLIKLGAAHKDAVCA